MRVWGLLLLCDLFLFSKYLCVEVSANYCVCISRLPGACIEHVGGSEGIPTQRYSLSLCLPAAIQVTGSAFHFP